MSMYMYPQKDSHGEGGGGYPLFCAKDDCSWIVVVRECPGSWVCRNPVSSAKGGGKPCLLCGELICVPCGRVWPLYIARSNIARFNHQRGMTTVLLVVAPSPSWLQ